MASDSITFKGIILSSEDYKDKDKMITFLTADHGIIRVCAKGAAKSGSKSSFLSVPFMLCEIVASISKGFFYFKDGSIIESNSGIFQSLEAMTSATHIADVLKLSVMQTENSKEAYELAVYAFYMLGTNPDNYSMICSAFNWRYLSVLGLSVVYDKCSKCDTLISDNSTYRISILDGTLFCSNCFPADTVNNNFHLVSGKFVDALNSFTTSALNKVFTYKGSENLTKELQSFTFKYLSNQLEHNFNALETLNSTLLKNPVRRDET